MSGFKIVFKGYDRAQVEQYVKESESKILELQRLAKEKKETASEALSKKQAEIERKTKVLSQTFNVLLKLVKTKLSGKELDEFLLVADAIEKMSLACDNNSSARDKKIFNENLSTSNDICLETQQIPQKQNFEDPTVDDVELVDQIHNEKSGNETVQTSSEENILDENSNDGVVSEKVVEAIAEEEYGGPLIDLNEVYTPQQSLLEMCEDLGILNSDD